MPLSLLLPVGLAALAALLLPLMIHLARRSEHRLTEFAALRWLRARPRPRQRLRFDAWPLLLLRLLLLALLALLLARPVLEHGDAAPPQVLIAPGVALARAQALGLPADAQWHWLAPGFPAVDTPAPASSAAQASLLREFDAALPAASALSVVVPERWGALDAQIPQLSRRVRWEVVAGTASAQRAAPMPSPRLLAYADDPALPALRYLRALQGSWQPQRPALDVRAGTTAAVPPADITTVVWLVPAPLPPVLLRWQHAGGSVLLVHDAALPVGTAPWPRWQDARGAPLLVGAAVGRGQLLQFTRALDPRAMPQLLDADLPDALRAALHPPPTPASTFASTHRPDTGARAPTVSPLPLAPWLALAVALLFLLERWLASTPRRGAPR